MTQDYDNLLAIETSTKRLMLALSFGSDRLIKSNELVDRSHGQVIARHLGNLFESAGLSQSQLNGIIVSTGPGSFTGLRIGLAMAKGMASALKIPVVGISLYDLAAAKLRGAAKEYFAATQVRRDELLFARIVGNQFDPSKVAAVATAQAADYVGASPVIGIELDILNYVPRATLMDGESQLEFDAADLLEIGRARLESGQSDNLATLEPLYLQKSQAEIRFDERQKKN
ncbi:MAG: tRNA (adenosine(37)-N6)-threonylcarbamoyltransferase complex dimerization subunit type 1 TsaB [Candidatus Zixiibacteriota bacterium]